MITIAIYLACVSLESQHFISEIDNFSEDRLSDDLLLEGC